MIVQLRLVFVSTMFVLLAFSSCAQKSDIKSPNKGAAANAMAFDKVVVIFNNSQCYDMKGTVLYGYKNGQQVGRDGIRPVGRQNGYRYEVRSAGMTHWRWVASIDYSDRPENMDVVIVDTGIRPLTKEDWEITCRKTESKQEDGKGTGYTFDIN